jgi:hypothetical protein
MVLAFVEIAGSLSFVSSRLGVRIDRHASRQDVGDGIDRNAQLQEIRSNLVALESCFESAAVEARGLLARPDQLVS